MDALCHVFPTRGTTHATAENGLETPSARSLRSATPMENLFNESEALDDISQAELQQLASRNSPARSAHEPSRHCMHSTLLGIGSMVVTDQV